MIRQETRKRFLPYLFKIICNLLRFKHSQTYLSASNSMKKSAYLLVLLTLVSLASCARKNNCPAYGNTSVESTKR